MPNDAIFGVTESCPECWKRPPGLAPIERTFCIRSGSRLSLMPDHVPPAASAHDRDEDRGVIAPKHKSETQRGHFTRKRLPTRPKGFSTPGHIRPKRAQMLVRACRRAKKNQSRPKQPRNLDTTTDPRWWRPSKLRGRGAWWPTLKGISGKRCCNKLILKTTIRWSLCPNQERGRGGRAEGAAMEITRAR